jgi:deoxyribodipyrimidine photolyase
MARWFWDTLVDADLANNTMGWQWVAGTGADAAPYFRVFNPVTQAEKFDPQARYISRWVPELAALPVKARFAPWQHPLLLAAHAPAIRVRRWWTWPPAATPRWPPTGRRGQGKARLSDPVS